MSKELYNLHADFCKFMGNPKRIEMIFLLGESEMCVEELAIKMGISSSNVSQHLAGMREKGVVEVRREGVKMYYRLSNLKVLQACSIMRDAMYEQLEKNLMLMKDAQKE